MNKMHEAAKIAFAILGIYFLVGLLRHFVSGIVMMFTMPSDFSTGASFVSYAIMLGCAYTVIYFLIIKRGWLADKIISTDQEIASDAPANWLPVAYRLAVLIAAIYFLRNTVWEVSSLCSMFVMAKENVADSGSYISYYSRYLKGPVIKLMFTLPMTIYLLCGAPHFVRWQLKKTAEFCKQLENE